MKKSIIIILTIFLTITLHGQSLLPTKYGLKAGLNIANIKSTSIEGVENIAPTNNFGVTGGFYMEIALNDIWYINPELLYSQKGASFNYNYIHDYLINSRDEYETENELIFTYVELNPTISYKASEKLSLNFGPSISFLIDVTYTFKEDPENMLLDDGIFEEESLDIGFNLGISYYINEQMIVNSSVYNGLVYAGEVIRPIDTEEQSFTIKNKSFVFSIAYLFN